MKFMRFLFGLIAGAVLALIIVTIVEFGVRDVPGAETVTHYESMIDSLRHENETLRSRNADLIRSKPGLAADEVEKFKERGLDDPEQDIIDDLGSREDIMPMDGVFGARPSFYVKSVIYLLNGTWAYSMLYTEDKVGEVLLEYDVGQNGEITWSVIDRRIREAGDEVLRH